MKKVLLFLIVICLIPSCGKKKLQEEQAKEAKAKVERQDALKHLKSVNIKAYIIDYVFENKKQAIGTIPIVKIPIGTPFIFVYKGKEHSFILKNNLWGIRNGEKIILKEGYVKDTRYILVPLVIDKPQKFWTKSELMPWIIKYPLTAVEHGEGVYYPTYYDLPCFIQTATPYLKRIYLKEGPTLQATCGNIYLFFNSGYLPWGIRPEYRK